MKTGNKLSLSVQYASKLVHLPTRSQLRRWLQCSLESDAQITLRIVDGIEGRTLNRNFRTKDYATNVLTFFYDEQKSSSTKKASEHLRPLFGDIVICAPVVKREAKEQNKKLLAHYAHLTIHAALHLQGYDHVKKNDAAKMEALETALMLKLGYPPPYLVR